jgi:beta-galactosidase
MNHAGRSAVVVGCLVALACAGTLRSEEVRFAGNRRVGFDEGWRFLKSDAPGAEGPDFSDKDWRGLDLPHDWAIEGPFDMKHNPHAGGLPSYGVAWYRKHFTVPADLKGRYVTIEFDGAMANSRVFLNGQELGGHLYGYIGFALDLTPHLRLGGADNVLAVRLEPEENSSRWYPGAGLYRHVWLDATGPVHVGRWGTYVTTPSVTDERATVAVRTELRNRDSHAAQISLETSILNPDGKTMGGKVVERTLAPGATESVDAQVEVAAPQRWDVDHPHLYQVVSTIRAGAQVLDRYVSPLGIRTISFDKAQGFQLNGRRLKLQGVCMHHDLGALGAAVNRRATERQLQIMKAMGVNAVRTSHNPPSPELLDAADRLGLLVMDEAFDMWGHVKVKNGHGKYFAEWGEKDLRDMLRRDRNHPSIIMWSIGNEILEQSDPEGWKVAKRLTEICHEEDRTRPVTAGFNQADNAIKNGLAAQVDIPGFNYQARNYERFLKEHPDWTIVATETSSAVSSRGVYHLPIDKYVKHESLQITSYDVIAPEWAYEPDVEFDALERSPQVLGEFVWTGFDYLGEPTPYFGWRETPNPKDWPARSSYFGIVDLAGFPKDRYYLYQSVWTKEPMVHVLPHWNWAGREGQAIPVVAYTNCDEVELFLNGKSLGRKRRGGEPMEIPVGKNVSDDLKFKSKYRLLWQVPYEPGTLKVVGLREGKAVAAQEMRTAGAPARIALVPDRKTIDADGSDLSFVTVRVEDKDGNLCPLADTLVRFKIEGAGGLAAVDNGDPATTELFQASERKAFAGLALAIVRSERGKPGRIHVTATADGLTAADTTIETR